MEVVLSPIFWLWVAGYVILGGGLSGITTQLWRIAKALEERNKLQSRQTQP
ncbi:MAG: hypothetical protein ACLP9L_41190 [Thermoguttaceae bacterium]